MQRILAKNLIKSYSRLSNAPLYPAISAKPPQEGFPLPLNEKLSYESMEDIDDDEKNLKPEYREHRIINFKEEFAILALCGAVFSAMLSLQERD